jgi:hypothetical protein
MALAPLMLNTCNGVAPHSQYVLAGYPCQACGLIEVVSGEAAANFLNGRRVLCAAWICESTGLPEWGYDGDGVGSVKVVLRSVDGPVDENRYRLFAYYVECCINGVFVILPLLHWLVGIATIISAAGRVLLTDRAILGRSVWLRVDGDRGQQCAKYSKSEGGGSKERQGHSIHRTLLSVNHHQVSSPRWRDFLT